MPHWPMVRKVASALLRELEAPTCEPQGRGRHPAGKCTDLRGAPQMPWRSFTVQDQQAPRSSAQPLQSPRPPASAP